MAEATSSLLEALQRDKRSNMTDQHYALWLAITKLQLDCPAGIMTLAQQAAKKEIKRQLQAQGQRVAYLEAKAINAMAKDYLRDHMAELIEEAADAIASYGPLLKLAQREHRDRQRCAKLTSDAQAEKARRTRASAVQMS